jgi:hypothetical protein
MATQKSCKYTAASHPFGFLKFGTMQVITLIGSYRLEIMAALLRGSEARRARISVLFSAVAVFSAVIAWTFTASLARAAYAGDGHLPPENLSLPAQYGTIIYRTNEQSAGQLYIVGISHRDAENRLNHHNTAQVQLEIFRIGEWLFKNLDLELLLPEGYFNGEKSESLRNDHDAAVEMDTDLLYARLADDSRFVNAEMLLTEQFGLHASQVEDKNSYNAVCTCLGELTKKNCTRMQMEAKLDELQYLQEMRTAGMLQKIPSAIETKLRAGYIPNRSAMLTIGLDHIQDIIRYLQKNTITITPPERGNDRMESYTAELDLLREGYGITVIIPRTLADDRQLMQATRLDRMPPKDKEMLATNEPALLPQ